MNTYIGIKPELPDLARENIGSPVKFEFPINNK